jgi:hypothetical protein
VGACETCCLGKDDVNVKIKVDALNKCMCDLAKSKCSPDCAPGFCPAADGSIQAMSSACADSCDVDMDSCETSAKAACAADPTCGAADKCLTDAKCDSLPGDPETSSSGSTGSGDTDTGSSSDATGTSAGTSSGSGN